jgi:hypothetical protein
VERCKSIDVNEVENLTCRARCVKQVSLRPKARARVVLLLTRVLQRDSIRRRSSQLPEAPVDGRGARRRRNVNLRRARNLLAFRIRAFSLRHFSQVFQPEEK